MKTRITRIEKNSCYSRAFAYSRWSESRGFTLIELLVVVAIIGILSTVVFATIGGTRGRARDAKRLSDVKQMALMLNIEETSAVGGSRIIEGCSLNARNNLTTACTGVTGMTTAQKTAFAAEFQAFKDPSTPGTACTSSSASTCGYSISNNFEYTGGGWGHAETGNYQICFFLEDYPAAGQSQALLRAVSPGGNIKTGCPTL